MAPIAALTPIPRMDQLLAAGDSTIAPTDRKLIYAQVQAIAAEDLPYISLWWMDNVTVMNRRLHGFEPYPNGSLASLANCTLTNPRQLSMPVSHYLLPALLALIPVAIGVVTLTFAMIHLVPGDPVIAMLGDYAAPVDIVRMRHALRLDQPLWRQYAELHRRPCARRFGRFDFTASSRSRG